MRMCVRSTRSPEKRISRCFPRGSHPLDACGRRAARRRRRASSCGSTDLEARHRVARRARGAASRAARKIVSPSGIGSPRRSSSRVVRRCRSPARQRRGAALATEPSARRDEAARRRTSAPSGCAPAGTPLISRRASRAGRRAERASAHQRACQRPAVRGLRSARLGQRHEQLRARRAAGHAASVAVDQHDAARRPTRLGARRAARPATPATRAARRRDWPDRSRRASTASASSGGVAQRRAAGRARRAARTASRRRPATK